MGGGSIPFASHAPDAAGQAAAPFPQSRTWRSVAKQGRHSIERWRSQSSGAWRQAWNGSL